MAAVDSITQALSTTGLEAKDISTNPLYSGLDITVDPCLSCSAPCADGHAVYPAALAKTIDQCEDLLGSMKPYKRHLMFCAGNGVDWPGRLEEELSADSFMAKLGEAVQSGGKAAGRTIVSAIDRNPEGHSEDSERVECVIATECFLFPDYKGLRGVTATEAAGVVSFWVSKGSVPERIESSTAEVVDLEMDAYIFVCTHKKRDKRCGVTGPILVEEFNSAIQDLGLSGKVACIGISHIGGHKFAGNIIIYSKKFPHGVWYGRVIPCHVESIMQKTVIEGKVFKELFRGQGTA